MLFLLSIVAVAISSFVAGYMVRSLKSDIDTWPQRVSVDPVVQEIRRQRLNNYFNPPPPHKDNWPPSWPKN